MDLHLHVKTCFIKSLKTFRIFQYIFWNASLKVVVLPLGHLAAAALISRMCLSSLSFVLATPKPAFPADPANQIQILWRLSRRS